VPVNLQMIVTITAWESLKQKKKNKNIHSSLYSEQSMHVLALQNVNNLQNTSFLSKYAW